MKIKLYVLIAGLLLVPLIMTGQNKLEGKIFDADDKDELGMPGANVVWAGTTVGTTTNVAGYFSIKRMKQTDKLVISFVGYRTDTITVKPDADYITHSLVQGKEMEEVVIQGRASGTHIDRVEPILTVNITGAELCKAACCNLSESFETNASVDVNYADASTGAKQIQLLGLAGTYTQILTENIPAVYGLNTAYGLNFIPGPWMESIQISKGTSSVRNGYESMAGQINVEYKKPRTSEKFYMNGFISDAGRQEANLNTSVILNSRWSTMLFAHGERQNSSSDHNHDGFRDEPDLVQYNFFNRWDYMTEKMTFRTGIRYLNEERVGGQFGYQPGNQDTWTSGFGIKINTRRMEGFAKLGGVFGKDESMSLGWIQNIAYHDQESSIGRRWYDGTQKTYYTNLLFQWNPDLGNIQSMQVSAISTTSMTKRSTISHLDEGKSVPGIFAQYTFTDTAKITVIAGVRTDFHNLYGTLFTPRLHLRYEISPVFTFRASVGKGYRAGNVLAENTFLLASSREMIIAEDLDIEEAWNAGMSLTASVPMGSKLVRLSGEVYRTSFINQIIIDLDASTDEVSFYNLDGKSFSNVLQFEASSTDLRGI